MNKNDFTFDRYDPEYEDYWFRVAGETSNELTKKHMEMCMVCVSRVVYSNKESVVGVRREFPFNYDVVLTEDKELKQILSELVDEMWV